MKPSDFVYKREIKKPQGKKENKNLFSVIYRLSESDSFWVKIQSIQEDSNQVIDLQKIARIYILTP